MVYSMKQTIADLDDELWQAIQKEAIRQEDHLELIASENYASPSVLQAQGSILTNKYAEGYPGKRYYGGCKYVDEVEQLAIDRAKELFKAAYANVQPHSGSQANAATYMALLEPGDKLLGMSLAAGGHLTHGSKVSFSGKVYQAITYGVNSKTQLIDYDVVKKLAIEHKPKLIVAGFSAYSRIIDWQKFRDIADEIKAFFMVDMAHVAGLVAANLYPSPISLADVVTSTTHKTLRGPRGGLILAKSNPEIEKKLNSAVFPGLQGGPLMHVIAGKAIAFKEALQTDFKDYQVQVIENARVMAETMHAQTYKIVTGGTDNHLFLVDLSDKNITGKDAEDILEKAHITLNKNAVPNDVRSPFVTSGIRIGTPALTTRGLKEKEVSQVATWICEVLNCLKGSADLEKEAKKQLIAELKASDVLNKIKIKAMALCNQFPVYS